MERSPGSQSDSPEPRWGGLTRRLSTGGAVMGYHGFRSPQESSNAGTMHVAVDRFATTIRALRRVAALVPLRELVARHLAGESTRGLAAITFDDAYASVGTEAFDVIVAEAVPITLFVVIEAARSGGPFWWDRVDDLFAVTSARRWRAFEDECGLPPAFRSGQPRGFGPLRPLRQWILAEHRGRWPSRLEDNLARLERETAQRTIQRPLTFEELDVLLEHPLVDIGVHSVTHAVLPLLPEEEMRDEIRAGFATLRGRYARTIPVLAPPFGLYDERTVRVAREEGLTACLTLTGTLLNDRAPRPLVPRFGITSRHRPWKAVLYALGCWYGARPRRRRVQRYPDLPSMTT